MFKQNKINPTKIHNITVLEHSRTSDGFSSVATKLNQLCLDASDHFNSKQTSLGGTAAPCPQGPWSLGCMHRGLGCMQGRETAKAAPIANASSSTKSSSEPLGHQNLYGPRGSELLSRLNSHLQSELL